MQALLGDAEAHGTMLALSTTVKHGVYDERSQQFVLSTAQADGQEFELPCDYFVNATGLFAMSLLPKIKPLGQQQPPDGQLLPTLPPKFAKGTYFKLQEHVQPFRYVKKIIPIVFCLRDVTEHAGFPATSFIRFQRSVGSVCILPWICRAICALAPTSSG